MSSTTGTLATWLSTQELTGAEAMFILGMVMVGIIQSTWEKDEERPKAVQAYVVELSNLSALLAPMILMHRANADDLYGDMRRPS